jgi:hypothetical protein
MGMHIVTIISHLWHSIITHVLATFGFCSINFFSFSSSRTFEIDTEGQES